MAGKVAIVTGAAGNLGGAGAELLAREGARVVLSDLSPGVHDVAARLRADGHDAISHVGDASAEESVRDMVAAAMSQWGRLDALWSTAGIVDLEWIQTDTDVLGITLEHFVRTFAVNAGSVLLAAKHAIPAMRDGGGGSIIATSSIQGSGGDSVLASYGASKAAVEHLTRSIAAAFGPQGIRANAVAPGLIPPKKSSGHRLEAVAPTDLVTNSQSLPIPGSSLDIAHAVLYLASDESRFVTGQVLRVDGGFTGHLPTLADRRRTP